MRKHTLTILFLITAGLNSVPSEQPVTPKEKPNFFKCGMFGEVIINDLKCEDIIVRVSFNKKTDSNYRKTDYFTDRKGRYCIPEEIPEGTYMCMGIVFNDMGIATSCFNFDSKNHKENNFSRTSMEKYANAGCNNLKPWNHKRLYPDYDPPKAK